MKHLPLLLIAILFLGFSKIPDAFPVPENWPKPVYDFSKNPLSEKKIHLGRALFYDPVLSADNRISCESCHSPFSAFTHVDHALSHGIHDSIGRRNAPALMNLAWQRGFMWDGAINHLDMQALAPIAHPAEMGSSIQDVLKKLNASTKYRKAFYEAYGDSVATGERLLKSLSQFMLSLVSANSKYDQVRRGETQFDEQESRGYALFKQHCNNCHTQPLFSNGKFENNGLAPDPVLMDRGRMEITKRASDSLKFKVPTLRNIAYTYPYMHDGRFKKLSEVMNHYATGIHSSKTLALALQKGIPLDVNEKVDLVAFLMSLSDKEFVFNTDFRPSR